MTVEPATNDFTIYQGASFERTIDVIGLNLTGGSVALQARLKTENENEVLDMSTANGQITLSVTDANNATITLALTPAQTAVLAFGEAVYDLEVTLASAEEHRLLEGTVTLDWEVTRA